MSFDVQEGLLSPSKPLIFCNQVKSVLTYNGTDSGTFSTPHMIIDRDQKTVAFPAEIEMNFFTMTIRGEDAFYDITKQEGVIKKNACGQHALGCFKTGTLTFNTHEQMVIMDDGVQSEFFISRDKQPQQ